MAVATLFPVKVLRVPLVLALAAAASACSREADLVVYVALDQVYSEPILELFEERTGLKVDSQYDTEATKTVGHVNAILQEAAAGRPRADVFWNNETAQTVRLKQLGLTAPYESEKTRGIPAEFRDPEGHWTGFAARARVVMYLPSLLPEGTAPPRRTDDLIAPGFAGQGGMAQPLTGTTLTHFAALASLDGAEATLDWLRRAKGSGLHFGKGNAYVMRRVVEGDFAWCLTDTDDAAAARRNGHPVEILFLDQEPGGRGALLIPNAVCILAGARHREAAERLVDFLVSAEVEALLAASGSDQIPLRPGVEAPPHLERPGVDFQVMAVDWERVAEEAGALLPEFQALFTE